MILWATRLYRRYYLWSHKKHREMQERLHAMKMLLKLANNIQTDLKILEKKMELAENTCERKVLIEKYTQKDRARDLERTLFYNRTNGVD
jgi:hypothetical protein